jgi:histone H3/H4
MPPAQPTKQPPDTAPAIDEATPLAAKLVGIAKRKPKRIYAIPRVSFRRLVQEIADQYGSDLRIQQAAIDALQESAENLIAERFARCGELIELCKLDTVRDEHWRFVQDEMTAAPC